MNLFKKLFCLHKWEEKYRSTTNYINTSEKIVSITLFCKECGKIKKINP